METIFYTTSNIHYIRPSGNNSIFSIFLIHILSVLNVQLASSQVNINSVVLKAI